MGNSLLYAREKIRIPFEKENTYIHSDVEETQLLMKTGHSTKRPKNNIITPKTKLVTINDKYVNVCKYNDTYKFALHSRVEPNKCYVALNNICLYVICVNYDPNEAEYNEDLITMSQYDIGMEIMLLKEKEYNAVKKLLKNKK